MAFVFENETKPGFKPPIPDARWVFEEDETPDIIPTPEVGIQPLTALKEGVKDVARTSLLGAGTLTKAYARDFDIQGQSALYGIDAPDFVPGEGLIDLSQAGILKPDEDFQRPSGWKGYVQDVIRTGPQIASQIAATLAVGPLGGLGMMGLQITGGTYENLINQGVPEDRALSFGVANALMQAPLEQIGVGKILKVWKPQKTIIRKLRAIAAAAGTEWFTEFVQAYPDSIVNIVATNPDKTTLQQTQEVVDNLWETTKQGAYEGTLTAPWALLGLAGGVRRQGLQQPRPDQDAKKQIRENLSRSTPEQREALRESLPDDHALIKELDDVESTEEKASTASMVRTLEFQHRLMKSPIYQAQVRRQLEMGRVEKTEEEAARAEAEPVQKLKLEKPVTKRQKARREYKEYVESLTEEQKADVSGLILEKPRSPTLQLHKIQKKLKDIQDARRAGEGPEKGGEQVREEGQIAPEERRELEEGEGAVRVRHDEAPGLETEQGEVRAAEKEVKSELPIIEAGPERFEPGKTTATEAGRYKVVGRGDIEQAYSGDRLPDNKIRKPFKHDDKLWTNTGGTTGNIKGWELIPVDEYEGETFTYEQMISRKDKRFTYEGQRAKYGRKEYVLTNPHKFIATTAKPPAATETPPKLTEAHKIYNQQYKKWETVKGKKIVIVPWADTFAHKMDGDWTISESQTGARIAQAATFERVKDQAWKNLRKAGEKEFGEMIGKIIKEVPPKPALSLKPEPIEKPAPAPEAAEVAREEEGVEKKKVIGTAEPFKKGRSVPVLSQTDSFYYKTRAAAQRWINENEIHPSKAVAIQYRRDITPNGDTKEGFVPVLFNKGEETEWIEYEATVMDFDLAKRTFDIDVKSRELKTLLHRNKSLRFSQGKISGNNVIMRDPERKVEIRVTVDENAEAPLNDTGHVRHALVMGADNLNVKGFEKYLGPHPTNTEIEDILNKTVPGHNFQYHSFGASGTSPEGFTFSARKRESPIYKTQIAIPDLKPETIKEKIDAKIEEFEHRNDFLEKGEKEYDKIREQAVERVGEETVKATEIQADAAEPAKTKPEKPKRVKDKKAKKADYPVHIDPSSGKEYSLYGFGVHLVKTGPKSLGGTGWEWFAFEPIRGDVAFGLVHGFETEWGSFSLSELKENGVRFVTDPKELDTVAPPIGWTKKEVERETGQEAKPKKKTIGTNNQGLDVFEDEDGNRFIIRKGIKISAPRPIMSGMPPSSPQELFDTGRHEFLTATEYNDFKAPIRRGIYEILQQMRETEEDWRPLLPRASRRIYARLEEKSPDEFTTEDERQLQELRRNISEAREAEKETVSGVRKPEEPDASPGLQTTPVGGMAVPEVSPETTPTGIVERETILTGSSDKLARWVENKVAKAQTFSWRKLFKKADEFFGGTQAEGKYSVKDAYDAMELGINRFIMRNMAFTDAQGNRLSPEDRVDWLDAIQDKIPTQTKRTIEQQEFQQFSTPPPLAYVMNWVANIGSNDVILEPSAGTGNISIFPRMSNAAKVYVNELSKRRAELLKTLAFDETFTEDAEQLDNILPDRIKPTVVVMNPPFSATAGRLKTNATKFGAKHIEQALNRLEDGGRLVAITGKGMADEAPAFKDWWAKIKQKYNVRANIGISGEAYRKYGTTFDNRILVIDKTGKTDYVTATGKVDSYKDLLPLLKGVRDERVHPGKQPPPEPTSQGPAEEGGPVTRPAIPVRRPVSELQPGKEPDISEQPGPGAVGGEPVSTAPQRGGEGTQPEGVGGAERPGEVRRDLTDRTGQLPNRAQPELFVKSRKATKAKAEITDSIYDDYDPTVTVKEAVKHPTRLVQSSAMAARELPEPSYTPDLPVDIIKTGKLSDAQIEGIVYAGQAHDQMLDDGNRKGFFIGDGTGVGKGREIAAIIRDNWNQGRKKSVWITKRATLFEDAKRDMTLSGWELGAKNLFELPKAAKLGNKVQRLEGTMFVTYGTLRSGANKTAIDKPETHGDLTARINQIVDWLGDDFDGVVAFDESHKMANSIQQRQGRYTSQPALQAIAGMMLQKRMPQARILYVSATGATEVSNLAYAERLGLWGPGTPFTSKAQFIDKIASGGLNAMEMISGDMKSMGVYLARSLAYTDVSFEGDNVDYRRLEHNLTENQQMRYNKMAEAWQVVLNNLDEALEITNKVHDRHGVGQILSHFWGSQQRFFNQVITAMQMPTAMNDMQKQLDAGHAILIQLVNTNEAAQDRAFTAMEETGQELEDLDMTPREALIGFLETGFPVEQYEEYEDEEGNRRVRPVFDSDGNPVLNKEALRARDQLIMEVGSLKVEGNPLDLVIERFGYKNVAELTGRKRRVTYDDEQNKTVVQKRSPAKNKKEKAEFMDDKRSILMFSDVGSTGESFHADKDVKNQRKRVHYVVQPGWRADNAIQGLGRSHRSNQKQAPEYVLAMTDLPAQKRFFSSIARRLDQLGSLTKGQRQTGSGGIFKARDNLENEYARDSLGSFIEDIVRGNIEGIELDEFEGQTGLTLTTEHGGIKIPKMRQFLNRLLSLKVDMQNKVFSEFTRRVDEVIQRHAEAGTLDVGIETLFANRIDKVSDQTVFKDKKSGAETHYVQIDVTQPSVRVSYEDAKKNYAQTGFYRNIRSGKVWAASRLHERTDKWGDIIDYHSLTSTARTKQRVDREILDNEEKWTKLDTKSAIELWGSEYANLPETQTTRRHMITGTLLPVWNKLRGHPRIIRFNTSEGEKMLGREIHNDFIDETLSLLGAAARGKIELTGEQVADRVLNQNYKIKLDNGWRIERRTVSGDERIEVVGADYSNYTWLQDQGAFVEQISYQTRFFVPTDPEKSGKVLDNITNQFGVVSEQAPYSGTDLNDLSSRAADIIKGEEGTSEAYNDLVEVSRLLVYQGHDTFIKFRRQLRRQMSDVWAKIRHLARKLFDTAMRVVSNERGAIGEDPKPGPSEWAANIINQYDKSVKDKVTAKPITESTVEKGSKKFISGDKLNQTKFFNRTGIQLPTSDPKDLYRGVQWIQTMQDLARNYPNLKRLFNVQITRTAEASRDSIHDRELTEAYFKLKRKSKKRVNRSLFEGEDAFKIWTESQLRDQFGLTLAEIEGYKSVRNALDEKLSALVWDMLSHATDIPVTDEMVDAVKATRDKDKVTKKLKKLGLDDKAIKKMHFIANWAAERVAYVPHKWQSAWVVKVETANEGTWLLEVPTVGGRTGITREVRRNAAMRAAVKVIRQKFGYNTDIISSMSGKGQILLVRTRELPVDLFSGTRMDVIQSIIESGTDQVMQEYKEHLDAEQYEQVKDLRDQIKKNIEELYLAKGWGQHLIGRKGVKGYRRDLENVLAEYFNGFNAFVAKGKAARAFAKVMKNINPRKTPRQWKYGKEYIADMLGEVSEAGWFKRIAGTYFLAGDLSAATLNMTQNWTHAVPLLRTIKPKKKRMTAEREIFIAMKDIAAEWASAKGTGRKIFSQASDWINQDEINAVRSAYEQGFLDPQFLGETVGLHANKVWDNYSKQAWQLVFKMFTASEGWNRTSTFLAGYRRSIRAGMTHEEAINKADQVTKGAHFIYGKGNRPQLIRKTGAIGNIAYTFMTYPINNLVFLKHRTEDLLNAVHKGDPVAVKDSMKVIGSNLAYVFAFGGLIGLPFSWMAQTILNVFLDDDDDWEVLMRKHMPKTVGRAVTRGLPAALLGNDMSWRVQGTDALGMPIGFQIIGMGQRRAQRAMKLHGQGEDLDAVFHLMPDMVRNPYRAVVGFKEGGEARGKPPIKYSAGEAVVKGLGYTPTREAETFKTEEVVRGRERLRAQKLEDYAERFLIARKKGDIEARKLLKKEVRAYNVRQRKKGDLGVRIFWKDVIGSAKRRLKTRNKGYGEQHPRRMRRFQKETQRSLGL